MRGSHGDARLVARARSLRVLPSDAEVRLWSRLRNRQLDGHKFVRQFAIGPYFADFVCREASLVVEVDGGQHASSVHDARRDRFISDAGFSILRFWNNEVLQHTDITLGMILQTLEGNPDASWRFSPSPLWGEGRGEGPSTENQE